MFIVFIFGQRFYPLFYWATTIAGCLFHIRDFLERSITSVNWSICEANRMLWETLHTYRHNSYLILKQITTNTYFSLLQIALIHIHSGFILDSDNFVSLNLKVKTVMNAKFSKSNYSEESLQLNSFLFRCCLIWFNLIDIQGHKGDWKSLSHRFLWAKDCI